MTENKTTYPSLRRKFLVVGILILLTVFLTAASSASPIGPDSQPLPDTERSVEEINKSSQPSVAKQLMTSHSGASQGANKVVIPDGYAAAPGNSILNTWARDLPRTFQQVTSPALMSGLEIGDEIIGIAVRGNRYSPSWPPSPRNYADYSIWLGQSMNPPSSIDRTFANNRGPDFTQVRSGPLTFAPNSFPGGGEPNDFAPVISFTTPYVYQGGELLIEMSHPGNGIDWLYLDIATGLNNESAFQYATSQNAPIANWPAAGAGMIFQLIVKGASCDINDPNVNVIEGTPKNDKLKGTPGDDLILGYGGNDRIEGFGGNDCLVGGDGNDQLFGGDGNDIIWGGDIDNATTYTRDNDKLYGGDGRDELYGGDRDDRLQGDDGNDTLFGNGRRDKLYGNDGHDYLDGGDDRDTLDGGDGDDGMFGGAGDDHLNGKDGDDHLRGGDDRDKLYGGHGDDYMDGDGGDDTLSGSRGEDELWGGDGKDRLDGGHENDRLFGEAGDDKLYAGRGDDQLNGGADTDYLDGSSGYDVCVFGENLRSCEWP